MTALLAAGLVVLLHLAYLVYAAVGGFLGLRGMVWLWPHLISTAWCITVTLTAVGCPLTALEKWLLVAAGRTPYDGSFTAHYLRDVVYPYEYETHVWLSMIALAAISYVAVLRARLGGSGVAGSRGLRAAGR
ncbi:MAG TPA: DUF2784 domain-containing protein [Nocardioidaceae bacterium]|nr:DUF2784 domain-containing protein [Nocardioidaceae bacterium]